MQEAQFWQWSWTCEITLLIIAAVCVDVKTYVIFGSNNYVSSGANVTFICPIRIQSITTVTWLKIRPSRMVARSSTLLTDDSRISIDYDECHECSILRISNVTNGDSGLYTCQQKVSRTRRLTRSARISVQYAPTASAKSQVVDVAINSSAELECMVSAVPRPDITWYHENQEVVNDSTHQIWQDYANGSLVTTLWILSVTDANLGNYTCLAENREGKASTVITLQDGAPEIETSSEAANTTLSANEGGRTLTLMATFNVTGFILGMMPPIWISFYIILHLGFRSRYAEERPEEEGGDGLDEITYMAIV